MARPDDDTPESVGLLRLRNCCLFIWRESRDRATRTILIEPKHCRECIVELHRIGGAWRIVRDENSSSHGGVA